MDENRHRRDHPSSGKIARVQDMPWLPLCQSYRECFANKYGRCTILRENHFPKVDGTSGGGRACPFYRSTEDNKKEQKECLVRLISIGRRDLIERYQISPDIVGVFDQDFTDGVSKEIAAYRASGCRRELAEEAVAAEAENNKGADEETSSGSGHAERRVEAD